MALPGVATSSEPVAALRRNQWPEWIGINNWPLCLGIRTHDRPGGADQPVRGPKYVVTTGKTLVLDSAEWRKRDLPQRCRLDRTLLHVGSHLRYAAIKG
jgi:hypothetical protein